MRSQKNLHLEELNYFARTRPQSPLRDSSKKPLADEESISPRQAAARDPNELETTCPDDMGQPSFELVIPEEENAVMKSNHWLEQRSELLFSGCHLQAIFDDPQHLRHFSKFLFRHQPALFPLLTYHMDALKALRAVEYSNAVLREMKPQAHSEFNHDLSTLYTTNPELKAKVETTFEAIVREVLPTYITHTWTRRASAALTETITGTAPHSSRGLAEVFCLTDPSRHDNPIVFMTEEFNKTTQYGVDYVIGRNCRFLQGPSTNPFSIRRIREKLEAGVEHYETLLNYRRDGSPFMNLLMVRKL